MKFIVYVKFAELHNWLMTHIGPPQFEPSLRKFIGDGWIIDVGKFTRINHEWLQEHTVTIDDEEKSVLFAMRFL